MRREQTLHAVSSWKDCYPYFAEDKRFTNLVGRVGSNPLDLFKVSGERVLAIATLVISVLVHIVVSEC